MKLAMTKIMDYPALIAATVLLLSSQTAKSQDLEPPGAFAPIVEACGPGSNVVCVNRYGSVLPYPFYRNATRLGAVFDFKNTSVPSDPSFSLLSNASFAVFDRARGLELLGESPSNDFIFSLGPTVHEAPVYIPGLNNLYFSSLSPGYLPQLVVDLDANPPTLSEYLPLPPVYAANGGTSYANGTRILFAGAGSNSSIGDPPLEHAVSLNIVDPFTNTTTVILNNYYGNPWNGFDDVTVNPGTGDIFFTDADFSWYMYLTERAPLLPTGTYRFVPSTGATFLIDNTLVQPNGIALSPDGSTLYVSDTAAADASRAPDGIRGGSYNTTLHATIYAFDVTNNGTRFSNKRSLYQSQTLVPDGLKVSREGFVVTATGMGVDVLDDVGQLILRVQTNHSVQNFAWAGEDLKELWMVGSGGVSRVRWNIQGQALT